MSILTKQVRNATVYYDSLFPWRWYNAYGSGVCKYLQEFVALPVDDATHAPLDFTNTLTGASTAEVTDFAGGALLITSAGAEDDGYRLQLGHASTGVGRNFNFIAQYPFYFGINLAVSNASETDFFVGLAVTDTDALGAVTDGIYFRKVDGDTNVYFVAEKNSVESATAVLTMMGAQYRTFEIYYDGITAFHYVDNALTGSISRLDPHFPNDELMRLTIEFLTGSADVRTMTIDWVKILQIRD